MAGAIEFFGFSDSNRLAYQQTSLQPLSEAKYEETTGQGSKHSYHQN